MLPPAPSSPHAKTPSGTTPLERSTALVGGIGSTARVAARLLTDLGADVRFVAGIDDPLDAELHAADEPSVIRAHISWHPPDRPGPAGEIAVQAACGLMGIHGRRHGSPRGLGVDYASTAAGVLGVTGILAAILAGGRRDVQVHTTVVQAALLTVAQYLAAATCGDDEPVSSNQRSGTLAPPFVSSDGIRFEIETLDARRWEAFWHRLGADSTAVRRGWRPFQFRYATATAALPETLHGAAARHRLTELAATAAATGIGMIPLATPARHANTLGLPDRPLPPAWSLGRHAPEEEPGLPLPAAAEQPAGPRHGDGTLPLMGVVVLEAGRRIQAPMAGHVLRLLGARVIRIEPPGGDPLRGMPPMAGDCSARFVALNHGKEAVELDVKDPADRRRLLELAARADVFLHNWAPGKAAAWGLDAPDFARSNPRLVYAYTSGWGRLLGADPPPGTDFMVQAHSGLAHLVQPSGALAAPSLMTLLDVLGGLVGAAGILAGLLARRRTGTGCRMDSSLHSAACVLAGPALMAAAAGTEPPRPAEPCDDGATAATDLSLLAADPRLAGLLTLGPGCLLLDTPWRFT